MARMTACPDCGHESRLGCTWPSCMKARLGVLENSIIVMLRDEGERLRAKLAGREQELLMEGVNHGRTDTERREAIARAEKAEAERDRARAVIERQWKGVDDKFDADRRDRDAAIARAKKAEAEAGQMRAALETRGQHRDGGAFHPDRCDFLDGQRDFNKGTRHSEPDDDECNCGLYAALATDAGKGWVSPEVAAKFIEGAHQVVTRGHMGNCPITRLCHVTGCTECGGSCDCGFDTLRGAIKETAG